MKIDFTPKEIERLTSIVRSRNGILKQSGDWPERKLDTRILFLYT